MERPAGRAERPARGRQVEYGLTVAAAVLVVALQLLAADRQSLIGDAPYHLLAGDQALRDGANVLNLEHPPLVKLIAALPLQVEERIAPPVEVDQAIAASRRLFENRERFNRVRHRSRGLILVLFALPWIGACFLLGRELAGRRAGVLLALAAGLSINVLPYLSVLQTDTAVSLAFTLTALTAVRFLRRPSAGRGLALGAALGLGLAAKFSGVLLLPVLAVVAWRAFAHGVRWRRLAAGLGLAVVAALGVVAATYALANRDYDSEAGRAAIRLYCQDQGTLRVEDHLRPWEERLLAVERVSPSLAQWLTGFAGIRAQNAVGVYPSYAFGEISYRGRWWYFPVVLLVKTPLALLAATLMAAVAALRKGPSDGRAERSRHWRGGAGPLAGADSGAATVLILTIVAIYLGTSMTSSYNLGMRHLLPIMPFLLLPAALWAARRRWRAGVLVLALALEAIAVSPLWMSATNTWWLGSLNPTRAALSHSNFEAHQNFISLRRHARRLGLEPLHVVHPGLYAVELHAYFPEARLVRAGDDVVPGWYAVSALVEQYLPAVLSARPGELRNQEDWQRQAESWAPLWEQIRSGDDLGAVAGTFRLYLVPPKGDKWGLSAAAAASTPPPGPPG